jgi:hypothetical protein
MNGPMRFGLPNGFNFQKLPALITLARMYSFKIDFERKICHSLTMNSEALRRSVGRALSVDTYERGDHRYQVVGKDKTGQRSFASRGSPAEAKSFQTQNIAELERHREGRFNLAYETK